MQNFAETPVVTDMPRVQVQTGESLVVLTRDKALVQTLKNLGSRHVLATVAAESDLAGELLGKQTGVAIIDAGAATSPIEQLTARLKEQFPDLVLIVAGRLDDQNALAGQITGGTVYRFLHKPVSEQRVKLFVDAAWRRHGEELSGVSDPANTAAMSDSPPKLSRNTLLAGVLVLAALAAAGAWLMTRTPAAHTESPNTQLTDETRDAQLESAFAANAASEKTIDKLLSAAEAQLAAQHLDEAQKLTDQARAIKPDHVRVAFVTTQIAKERERMLLAHARQEAERRKQALLNQPAGDPNGEGASDAAREMQTSPDAAVVARPAEMEEARAERTAAAPTAITSGAAATALPVSTTPAALTPAALTPAAATVTTSASATAVPDLTPAAKPAPQDAGEAKPAPDIVSAANLELTHFTQAVFPVSARERGLSGWVEMEFLVTATGSVSDVVVKGAEPVGVFEQAAADAVRKWRYKPVQRDGHAVDQRARLRMKFALDK